MSASKAWDEVARTALELASDDRYAAGAAQLACQLFCRTFTRVDCEHIFDMWQQSGFHVTPVHYYAPIPDTRRLDDDLWKRASSLLGIEMNDVVQLEFLRTHFPKYQDEYDQFPRQPTACPYEFYFENGAFGGTDALALYCMIRHFQPRHILEIGAGFSTRVAARAALMNGTAQLVSVEPNPDELLRRGFPGLSSLIAKPVQDIAFSRFEALAAGDFLFIDSSHVVQIGSDVNYLFLEVLPRLKPGVIVHVHDIFFPEDYPKDWVKRLHYFWTEQYLLHAFLLFNSEFEVLLCNSFLGRKYHSALKQTFPKSPWWGGGSFWMRRKAVGR